MDANKHREATKLIAYLWNNCCYTFVIAHNYDDIVKWEDLLEPSHHEKVGNIWFQGINLWQETEWGLHSLRRLCQHTPLPSIFVTQTL